MEEGDEDEDLLEVQEPEQLDLCLNPEHLLHLMGRELVVNFFKQWEQYTGFIDTPIAFTFLLIVSILNFLFFASLMNLSFRIFCTNQTAAVV